VARVLPVNPNYPPVAGGIAAGLTLRFAVNLADSNTFVGLTLLNCDLLPNLMPLTGSRNGWRR
jgi:hypothetical protein